MDTNERQDFAARLNAVWALYDKVPTEGVLSIFWETMKGLSLREVSAALSRHVTDPDRGQFAPKPADLIRQMEGDTESQAMQAWSLAWRTVGTVGTYRSVQFDDPIIHAVVHDMGGWIKFGEFTVNEEPFRAKDFVTFYRAYKARRAIPEHPPVLIGRTEAENRRGGFLDHIPAPHRISRPQFKQLEQGGENGSVSDSH